MPGEEMALQTKEISIERASFAHVFLSAGSWTIGGVAETVECRVSGLRVELGREISPLLQLTIL